MAPPPSPSHHPSGADHHEEDAAAATGGGLRGVLMSWGRGFLAQARAPGAVAQRGLRAFRPNLFKMPAAARVALAQPGGGPTPAADRALAHRAGAKALAVAGHATAGAGLFLAHRAALRASVGDADDPPPAAAAAAGALGGAVHATLAAPFLAVAEARSFAPVTDACRLSLIHL